MATPHGGVRCPALTGADNTGIRSGPLFAAGHEPANPLGGVTSARPDIPGEVLSAQNGEALGVPTRVLLAAASARVGPAARQFCRHTLSGWHLTAVAADANWLSVNGLLHGSPPIELALSMVSGHLEVAVADASTDSPRGPGARTCPATSTRCWPRPAATAGPRTTAIPATLVPPDRWSAAVACFSLWSSRSTRGVALSGHGKSVWARLAAGPDPDRPTANCPCPNAAGGIALASGRRVVDQVKNSPAVG